MSRRKQESIDACLANTADAVMRAVEQGASTRKILESVRGGFNAAKRTAAGRFIDQALEDTDPSWMDRE